MNSKPKKIYRSPEQAAFADYLGKLKAQGYKKKEVAVLCHLTPQAVSMILSGERNPGSAALELLRRAVEGSGSEGTRPMPPKDEIQEKLGDIKAYYPEGFEAVKGLIQTLHKQVKKPASGKPSLRDLATKAHPLRAEVREPKPEADKPSENKPAQHTRVSRRPKDQQAAPTQAPSEPAHSHDS